MSTEKHDIYEKQENNVLLNFYLTKASCYFTNDHNPSEADIMLMFELYKHNEHICKFFAEIVLKQLKI